MNNKKRHHHGDLRNALIEAGLVILAEQGLCALTLRACAARAGVSHAAPAHHFGHLENLLTAIVVVGFKRFRNTMLDFLERAVDEPQARLTAICEAYVSFAQMNPHLFQLMFSAGRIDKKNLEFQQASGAAYSVLKDVCMPLKQHFMSTNKSNRNNELMIWSLVHGYAYLAIENFTGPGEDCEDIPTIAELLPALEFDG